MIYYFIVIFYGLILGSFLSVIISRLDQKSGLWMGRSECPNCLTKLRWYDLFPILSFMFLKGKCRYCDNHISWLYPIMELSVAGSFLLYYIFNGQSVGAENLYWLFIIFVLLILFFFDYVHFILPDKLILTAFLATVLYNFAFNKNFSASGLFMGLALAGFFSIIFIVSKGEWMGLGDVKLAFLIGFIFGYPIAILSIITATWLGALLGLGMMAVGRASLKTELPFGTFISGAAIIFIIFNEVINRYVQYIF